MTTNCLNVIDTRRCAQNHFNRCHFGKRAQEILRVRCGSPRKSECLSLDLVGMGRWVWTVREH